MYGWSFLVIYCAPGEVFFPGCSDFSLTNIWFYLTWFNLIWFVVNPLSWALVLGYVSSKLKLIYYISIEPRDGLRWFAVERNEVITFSFRCRYRGIGIRIEDDVLITENGAEILTAECPKEVEEIERLMSRTRGTWSCCINHQLAHSELTVNVL